MKKKTKIITAIVTAFCITFTAMGLLVYNLVDQKK